jgi:hypothetical protein
LGLLCGRAMVSMIKREKEKERRVRERGIKRTDRKSNKNFVYGRERKRARATERARERERERDKERGESEREAKETVGIRLISRVPWSCIASLLGGQLDSMTDLSRKGS